MSDLVNEELPGTAYVAPGSKDHIKLSNTRNMLQIWKNIFIGIGVFSAGASIVINLIIVSKVFTIVSSTNNNSKILIDCTTPGHTCYERERNATSDAVGTINRVTIIAIACAKVPVNITIPQIQACVQVNIK